MPARSAPRKGCDWILANDVSPGTGTFGGDRNTIHLVDADGVEDWPVMTKREVAVRLADRIATLRTRAGRRVDAARRSTPALLPAKAGIQRLQPLRARMREGPGLAGTTTEHCARP